MNGGSQWSVVSSQQAANEAGHILIGNDSP